MIRRSRARVVGWLLPALLGAVTLGVVSTTAGSQALGPAGTPAVAQAGGLQLADCQCGGPGGSADLAHISPWNNSACNSYVEVGRAGVHAYTGPSRNLTDMYIGWAQWVYSSNGSCHGYQWVIFHLSMAAVNASTASGGFTIMMWLTQDSLDWTTFNVTFAGGQADGTFDSYAVLAGPLQTSAGVTNSLVTYTRSQNPGGVFTA